MEVNHVHFGERERAKQMLISKAYGENDVIFFLRFNFFILFIVQNKMRTHSGPGAPAIFAVCSLHTAAHYFAILYVINDHQNKFEFC